MRSAVTISLVEEARGGPFVFHGDLPGACRKARELGFDAVEVFPPGPDAIDSDAIRRALDDSGLPLAAVGTGAGWVRRRLTLTAPDAEVRERARDFVRGMIDVAASYGAPAIIGSLQGRGGPGIDRETAMGHLAEALEELGEHARARGVRLLFEPLNRYETDLVNTVAAGVALLESLRTENVALLADVFHMNLEEADIAEAIRDGGRRLGHLHFVDSNRRPVGCGHVDYAPIARALADIGFDGYASAEALPYPDPEAAARRTIESFRRIFRVEAP